MVIGPPGDGAPRVGERLVLRALREAGLAPWVIHPLRTATKLLLPTLADELQNFLDAVQLSAAHCCLGAVQYSAAHCCHDTVQFSAAHAAFPGSIRLRPALAGTGSGPNCFRLAPGQACCCEVANDSDARPWHKI